MGRYEFAHAWDLDAARPEVFEALVDTSDWHTWWPQLESVETLEGDPRDPLDRVQRFVVNAPMGYTVTVVGSFRELDRPELLAADLDGDLRGWGEIRLDALDGDTTRIAYHLDVVTTKAWINALSPILRPFLRWNHDRVVERAADGLARKLRSPGP